VAPIDVRHSIAPMSTALRFDPPIWRSPAKRHRFASCSTMKRSLAAPRRRDRCCRAPPRRLRPAVRCRVVPTPSSWSSIPNPRDSARSRSARRFAGTIRILCRLRHRARRDAVARRHRDRLARDRHARGLRDRAGFRRAPAARRGHLHRRRTGSARSIVASAEIYDTNGAIVTAAVSENGGEAEFLGAIADDEEKLEAAMRAALETCDMLVLSGGTSRAPATCPTVSSPGSESPALSRTASL